MQEGCLVGSFVLLQAGDAVLKCFIALNVRELSQCAVAHCRSGATSGLPHKIIGSDKAAKQRIKRDGSTG